MGGRGDGPTDKLQNVDVILAEGSLARQIISRMYGAITLQDIEGER